MNSVIIRTENGTEAILQFQTKFENDEITVSISNTAFANFLEGLRAPNLRAINIKLLLEIENTENGQRASANLPIPPQLLDKSPAESREMDRIFINRMIQ